MFTSMTFSIHSIDANRDLSSWERGQEHIYKTYAALAQAISEKIKSSGEITFFNLNNEEIPHETNFEPADVTINFNMDGKKYRLQCLKSSKAHKVD